MNKRKFGVWRIDETDPRLTPAHAIKLIVRLPGEANEDAVKLQRALEKLCQQWRNRCYRYTDRQFTPRVEP